MDNSPPHQPDRAPSPKRPFVNLSNRELEARVNSHWSIAEELEMILWELRQRDSRPANALRERLVERLKEISPESFAWPEAAVLPSIRAMSGDQFWYRGGLLSFMGYHVGLNRISDECRRSILDRVVGSPVPRVRDTAYMEQWGAPGSSNRLQKLATSLASLARGRKSRSGPARNDWETDLAYLKKAFFDGKFNQSFGWPQTSVEAEGASGLTGAG
jgi:hypothetical protein